MAHQDQTGLQTRARFNSFSTAPIRSRDGVKPNTSSVSSGRRFRFLRVAAWLLLAPITSRGETFDLATATIADINRAYALGANSFINKSLDYQSTKDLVASIRDFWLTLNPASQPNTSPPKPDQGERG